MNKTLIFLSMAFVASTALAAPKSPYTLQSDRKPGQTDQVKVGLEVGGKTKFTDDGKVESAKMSVACDLAYIEKTLALPDKDDPARAIRDYQKVSATVTVGDGKFEPTLKPEHRLIAVEADKKSTLLFSPVGSLTRDELDAIDLQVNTLLLDRLLPEQAVAVGDSWEHSEDLMAALLDLDEVAKTTVKSTLKEVKDEGNAKDAKTYARFEISGLVEGAILGVSTKIEIKGKYRFLLQTKRIDWIGLLIKEDREPSFVADGVDATSRLQVIVAPCKAPESLSEEALGKLTLKPTPELTSLIYDSPGDGWQCQYDRRWHIYHQRQKGEAAVLRFVERGMLTGQCNVAMLPKGDPANPVSLEKFQEDARLALDKSFGEFVGASESSNAAGCRVYRVVIHGTASDITMRWIYYLVSDAQGRQVTFTFTVEQSMVEPFADADKPMVQSLRFLDDKPKPAAKPTEPTPAEKG